MPCPRWSLAVGLNLILPGAQAMTTPILTRNDEMWHPIHCCGNETAEGQAGARGDFDGVWRIWAL